MTSGTNRADRLSSADLEVLLRRDTAVLFVLALLVGAGGLLGLLVFHLSGGGQRWPTTVTRTATGWRVGSPEGLAQSNLALSDDYLAWCNGGCLEVLDLRSGKTTVLESPPSDGTAGPRPIISDRYVVWLANSDANSSGTTIRAYDLAQRRRFVVTDTGTPNGIIVLSHTTLYWGSGDYSNAIDPSRVAIYARDLVSGRTRIVVAGDVQLVDASGDLVVWIETHGKLASDQLTVVKDISSGRTWRLHLCPKHYEMGACSLSGGTLVWEVVHLKFGSLARAFARIEAFDLNSGTRRVVDEGPKVWAVAARDGHILWSNTLRNPGDGHFFLQSAKGGAVLPLPAAMRFTGEFPVISASMIAGELDQGADGAAQVEISRLGP
jgi:hypothetical protein